MNIKKILPTVFLAISISLSADEIVIILDDVVVTAQGREELMSEVPITMSTLRGHFLEQTNTQNLVDLANFVPGLNVRIQTPHRPTFVIRGLTSDEVSPTAQPRVSTYFNNAPISRASMAKSNLLDMERVEVVKGPQGTLFGRGSQIGGINFITRKPTSNFEGHISAGIGNFGMKEVEAVVNAPIIDNKLMVRFAGNHRYRDGFVENLSGGNNLGDENSTNARLSLRYLPMHNFRIDLIVDYQNDRDNGTPFMSKRFPNTRGERDIFNLQASLDPNTEFYNRRELFGTMLDMRYQINDRNYITSLTSFHDNWVSSRWDGDGTQASAIDMSETVKANQFTQEFRWNFTQNRFNGFIGTSYWREDVHQTYGFNPNEQYLVWLLMDGMMPGMGLGNNMILSDGTTNPMSNEEFAGMLAGMGMMFPMPLPPLTARQEMRNTSAVNSAFDIFANFDYNITNRLTFTAGVRGTWENLSIRDFTNPVEGSAPSTLGMLMQMMTTQTYNPANPNFLFAVSPLVEQTKTYFSTIWRANLKYRINDRAMVFAGYSDGRRPPVLQPTIDGRITEINSEKVNNFEIGFKYFDSRIRFDAGLFYYFYRDFQAASFKNFYTIVPVDRAESYGAEFNLNVLLYGDGVFRLNAFGNYAYIHARFKDDVEFDGDTYEFKNNRFRLTPDHSFSLGLNARANITNDIDVTFTPTYSWRSKVYFEDDNNPELTQDAFGVLNLSLAFHFHRPSLNVSFFAHNATNEQYIISAGNTGLMFGAPTFVPGLPRTFGTRVRWNF